MENKKRIFSGIKPTGSFTLGNYIGALRNWAAMQDEYDCIFSVVDMHAITIRMEPSALRKLSMEAFAVLLAIGIDPQKSTMFFQSHVSQHTELAWILNCYSQYGEMARMTQFKEKSEKQADNINLGLFAYPSLMAADILLYDADLVPVGEDQKQHLELARNIAVRFNGLYGDVFTIPEPYIPKVGARIMSLQNPAEKMGKSEDNENSIIYILDKKDDIIRKFKRAVTDSDTRVYFGEDKAGINNLMTIYSVATGKTFAEIEKEFDGRGYGDFKIACGESVAQMLQPIREKYELLISDKKELEQIYKIGAEKAKDFAFKKLKKVQKKVGFII